MAKIIVEIDLGCFVKAEDILKENSCWMEGDKITVDESYLKRAETDDSFFLFKLLEAKE